jgi:hypothetical protein
MGEKKINHPVRLFLKSRLEVETLAEFETLMVLTGKDANAWLVDTMIRSAAAMVKKLGHKNLKGRKIVTGGNLMREAKERFGIEYHRNDLKFFRDVLWKEGEEYYSAPNGQMRAFRYDLEKCLPALENLAAKRRERVSSF